MKYTIETIPGGCRETLEFEDGSKFITEMKRTAFGAEGLNPSLSHQLESAGFCEEIVDKVDELYCGSSAYDFLELAELEG